ncbi:MAG: 8-oxo-dGTP diphosphatase MutT [Verrucomicrobiota bacterium]
MKENHSDLNQNLKLGTQNLIEVSAGLVFRGGLVLITQRRQQDHLGGLWEFPGGKRECDESDEACLRRELQEELGIEVEVQELIETISHSYPEKTVHLKFFRCALLKNEPQPIGCASVAWVSAGQLVDYPFPEADVQLLEKLRATPEWWA